MAASSYSVLYQVGMWVTIISDGLSIATQSLLSRYLAQHTEHGNHLVNHIIRRSFAIGILLSSTLVTVLSLFRVPIISFLTKRPDIQAAALEAFPIFMVAQGEWRGLQIYRHVDLLYLLCASHEGIFCSKTVRCNSGQRICVPHQWDNHGGNGLGSCHVVHVYCQCGMLCRATSGRT